MRVLITGITGQDGSYLAKMLLDIGYTVFGIYRRISTPDFWRLNELEILDRVQMIQADLTDASSLVRAVEISQPDYVFNLGAQSHVGASFDQPLSTLEATGLGVVRLLEAVKAVKPDARFYQAGSSEMFGNSIVHNVPLDEDSPLMPASPYAIAKLAGYHACKIYRESYGIQASNGILFNHESPLRGMEFVTRKITDAVARIKAGRMKSVELGNIDARRDWGYAPEYVRAMLLMLQQDTPGDYVIATGESHSVREFLTRAFKAVDLQWEDHVKLNGKFTRPNDVRYLLGDARKARSVLGWEPQVKFEGLVDLMIEADLARVRRATNG